MSLGIYQGFVIDWATKLPVVGAEIAVTDATGKPTGQASIVDQNGSFEVVYSGSGSPFYSVVSSPGYSSLFIRLDQLPNTGIIELARTTDKIPVSVEPVAQDPAPVDPPIKIVNVIPQEPTPPPSLELAPANFDNQLPIDNPPASPGRGKIVLIGLGALAVGIAIARSSKKKKRVGGAMEGVNLAQYILPVGILVGGGYVVKKILDNLGITPDPAQEQRDKDFQTGINDNITSGQNSGVASTKTDAEWLAIADTIYEDLKYSAFDDNKADAGYQIARPKNDTDVYKLVQAFGKRREYYFGLPMAEQTLPVMVRSNLDASVINQVNDNFLRKGIKFRW